MCQLLSVTRSGYYGYQRRNGGRGIDYYHQKLLEVVKEIAKASDDTYGSRRIKKSLCTLSYPVSRNKARKLMKEAGAWVKCRKKYKATTNSDHKQPVFDNVLNRQFDVKQRDQAYVDDITYLWTQEGLSSKEIQRCLKRYIVRELFPVILGDLGDNHKVLT